MHLLQDAPNGFARLSGRSNSYSKQQHVAINTITKIIKAPHDAGRPLGVYYDAFLLAWSLLLSRGRSDDIDQFNWGYRCVEGGGHVSAPPFSLSAPGLDFLSGKPISTYLEAVRELTARQSVSTIDGIDGILFNDGKSVQKEAKGFHTEQSLTQWIFQVEISRPKRCDGHNGLTLRALWRGDAHNNSALTERQVHDRLDTFVELLRTIVQQPGTSALDLLGPLTGDLDKIWAWNAAVPPTIDRCIHDIISAQASRLPNKTAVESWDGEFTYAEVETLSTRLAHILRSRGLQHGDVVPLCFEKSRWTVVAVLAVMKAGGTFALTDPTSQPEARLKAMVEQTKGNAIVASLKQSDLARRIASEGAQVVVVSDGLLADTSAEPSEKLQQVATDMALYIQFTSGSTGKPKGVVISHVNYTSSAIPRAQAVGYKASSRVFEFASYAFDVSIDCMLCTLAVGGTICIPSDADRMNDLGGAIVSSGANMAHMTPSVARVLDPAVIAGLDVLGLGGEAVSASDVASWSSDKTSVIIAYGPSECTVGCTINNSSVSTTGDIGQGVGGVTWIVDPDNHDRLVPVGAVGELLIEGPLVGIGYLDEPARTAEAFITDPAWLVAGHPSKGVQGRRGQRLYKTGDLVKYDPNGSGNIVFVGRKDAQVKLRGQRVELVEVEHHHRDKLPQGTKLAAEVIRSSGGEPTLVMFLAEAKTASATAGVQVTSPSPELAAALNGIDEALAAEVPRYMVPAAYIPLTQIPSLVSGKTDRKKLREIGAAMTREQVAACSSMNRGHNDTSASKADDEPRRPPETGMERALYGIWRTLLNLDGKVEVCVQDSFFAVGGDSLKAMKLVAAARAEGIALTVADAFRHPTLSAMAAIATRVEHSNDSASDDASTVVGGCQPFSLLEADAEWTVEDATKEASQLCGVEESAIEDIYPCTPLQEALAALSAKVKEAYVAQRVLRLSSMRAARRLQTAFDMIAADCAILRTRIVHSRRGLVQVVVREPITWRSAASVKEYLQQDRDESMDLGKPLVRFALMLVDGNNEDAGADLVLTMHHALYDGWCMPLVVDRVNTAYQGLLTQEENQQISKAPRRPAAEFKDFIRYLTTTMDRAACENYWREQLSGATGVQFPALPFEGYQSQADSLLEVYVSLDGRRSSCSNHAITLATVIRAAWALVASQYTSTSNDVVFGETLTGRNAPVFGADEIEGPMIATVPIRVRIDRDATVEKYLRGVADQMIEQMPYEHAGLQHIRRLSPDALQACELRTGLVLHPAENHDESEDAKERREKEKEISPAIGLVPAGDDEAAAEALKFNTYALMLVCSLAPEDKGFLVMASFDSHTVKSPVMQRVLEQFNTVTQQLWKVLNGGCGDGQRVKDVQCLTAADKDEVRVLSKGYYSLAEDSQAKGALLPSSAEAVWIVDPADTERLLPRGAMGELVIEAQDANLPVLGGKTPNWVVAGTETKLYRTGRLAKFDSDMPTLHILGEVSAVRLIEPTPKQATETMASRPAVAVAVTTPKQKTLRSIWSRLLRIDEEKIGLGDSFFRLGGDSITAMKLVSELRRLQGGFQLTVAQVFANRSLYDMANAMQGGPVTETAQAEKQQQTKNASPYQPFILLPKGLGLGFIEQQIRPKLADPSWRVADVLPTRPLQEIAVQGTVKLPRFSIRYEVMYFDGQVDKNKLLGACQELVARNEILRTVFVDVDKTCYGVVLDQGSSRAPVQEYNIETSSSPEEAEEFTRGLVKVDAQTRMSYGSSFVKFLFIQSEERTTLVFRLSHAQYDEMCLPLLLKQLSTLYEGGAPVPESYPFSKFVRHATDDANVRSATEYWRTLLGGSRGVTKFMPDKDKMPTTKEGRMHFAIQKTVDISARSRDVTVASYPSAAWALTLARRTGQKDVVFGEVVSGRSVDVGQGVVDANSVAGPCWQYVPFRIQFGGGGGVVTGKELVQAVQHQHMASSAHENMGLSEIVRGCTDWKTTGEGEGENEWFDTVVHQAVAFVDEMAFGEGAKARMETIYPHQEPLREWKIQAFRDEKGEEMTIEIVTFQQWAEEAEVLLGEVCEALVQLVHRPGEVLGFLFSRLSVSHVFSTYL
ncbi:Nonribosomal peptide synthetase 4 [Diplogelasinospora grovesii]|uniref:Nonribosomal peptide synthetase 4 n=1 Tax=Diplogelasinospora grovesii TaxID=303347 RepID=A0AAN6N1R5_9PEZI|nr:Nonribosomal peptide synthetase 4 [Diplogelasinospora grovesii]